MIFLFEIIPLFVITSTKTKLQSNFNLQNFWKKRFIVLVFVSSFFITHSFDRRVFCSYKIFCIKKWLFYVYSELFVHIFFSFYVLCMLFIQPHRKPIIYRFAVHFGLAGPLLYEQPFTLLELVPAVGPGITIDNNNDKVSKIERYMFQ